MEPNAVNDINVLEKVQRRANKLVPALKSLPYEKRLVAMNLTELADRRIRGDMIQLYRVESFYIIDSYHIN